MRYVDNRELYWSTVHPTGTIHFRIFAIISAMYFFYFSTIRYVGLFGINSIDNLVSTVHLIPETDYDIFVVLFKTFFKPKT